MKFSLLDRNLCDPTTLKSELVEELKLVNEGRGWKGCRRRSHKEEPPKSMARRSVKPSPQPPIQPDAQPEPSMPDISFSDVPVDVESFEEEPLFEDIEEKFVPLPPSGVHHQMLPSFCPRRKKIPKRP